LKREPLPAPVRDAYARAEAEGFALSCEPAVGWLLATLAAGVPRGARILELGTGAGAGLAWIVHGLGDRRDVQVTSVDLDPAVQQLARRAAWPAFVRFEQGDGAARARDLAPFDLVFAARGSHGRAQRPARRPAPGLRRARGRERHHPGHSALTPCDDGSPQGGPT
jgi:predicted O-methyltransferase YrrM